MNSDSGPAGHKRPPAEVPSIPATQDRRPAGQAARRGPHPVAVVGLTLLILAAGVGAMVLLMIHKPEPEREEHVDRGPLVEATVAVRTDDPVVVNGHGTVEPRVMIDLVPQVSGKVTKVADVLTDGGRFEAGAVLIEIDRADYELALARAQANLAQARGMVETATATLRRAETGLELEQAEADVALSEWRSSHGDDRPPALLARDPQIRERQAELASARAQLQSAEASVQSAEAGVREAELNLERTRLTVPFAGRVMNEQVDVGQFVVAGQPLARVYGTDVARIVVPLDDEKLQWFRVPTLESESDGTHRDPSGAPATVSAVFAGALRTWEGRVAQIAGQVDPASRMVHVVVEVANPWGPDQRAPLVPGMFVDVAIEGRTLTNVIRVPRHAVRPGDKVWVVRDGRLQVVDATVRRTDREFAYLSDGVADGDVVVTSQLDVVVDGMQVRVPERLAEGPEDSVLLNATMAQ